MYHLYKLNIAIYLSQSIIYMFHGTRMHFYSVYYFKNDRKIKSKIIYKLTAEGTHFLLWRKAEIVLHTFFHYCVLFVSLLRKCTLPTKSRNWTEKYLKWNQLWKKIRENRCRIICLPICISLNLSSTSYLPIILYLYV